MRNFEDFTNLYSLQKTLRTGLLPIGATAAHIECDGILAEDEHRAESYLKMKKIIDCYHKVFIDSALSNLVLDSELLCRYEELYKISKMSDKETKEFDKVKADLRKQIVKKLTSADAYKSIYKKDLIQRDLAPFLEMERNGVEGSLSDNLALLDEFYSFTTYFKGFHKNRENMYSPDAKSTAIGYRLIHENLPKFIDNISIYRKIAAVDELKQEIDKLYKSIEEDLNVVSIDEIFSLDYYSTVLTQKQIAVYNMVIGGPACKEGEKKVQGLNEYIKKYNDKQTDKANRLPKLKPLFKQILSDREVVPWLPEKFKNDNEVLRSIEKAYTEFFVRNDANICVAEQLRELLCSIGQYSGNGIFIANDLQLTDISQHITGSWQTIQRGLCKLAEPSVARKKKETDEAYGERVLKVVKSLKNITLSEINAALTNEGYDETAEQYFANLGAVDTNEKQEANIFARIRNAYTDAEALLKSEYPANKHLAQNEHDVELIKNLLDTIKDLQRFVKPLLGKDIQGEKDEKFYSDLQNWWAELGKFTPLYSKVRNYMTKKPYSTEKIKLNFGNPILADGWPNPEQTSCVIFRDNGLYYLGVLKDRQVLRNIQHSVSASDSIELMHYAQAADPSKDIPNLLKIDGKTVKKNGRKEKSGPYEGQNLQIEQYRQTYLPKDINEIRVNKTFSISSPNFNKEDLVKYIDYYKQRTIEYFSDFTFHFKESHEYNNFSDFTNHVNSQAYQLNFEPVSKSSITTLVDEGKIYLFQIYNKDFSEYSKGTPNMHTMYWRMLFDERNFAKVIYKLNGGAELFFRKKSIESTKPTHPANVPIANKNKQNDKKQSVFAYDLIKDKRYTVDKFQLHVPITLNFVSEGTNNINEAVREYISQADDLHIIGIDRGERHLLYLTVIDLHGNIKEQFSLNEIVNEYNGNTYKTNYHDLLDTREDERQKSRQSWKSIETIKDLKEGYLSQVIHKITQLMMKYHAIVVLEDLNTGFMRGRQKVEKQVYQKFEKMLIDKLKYLVDKNADANVPSGVLKALQLTNEQDVKGKQNGFLFYIPAWNTSKIDPVTGFTNLFASEDLKYTSAQKAAAFFGKFNAIRYNAEKDWFEFKFYYSKFTSKANGTRKDWTLCTFGPRIRTFRNPKKNSQWDNEEIQLTDAFKSLLQRYGINIHGNIKNAIMEQGKDFFDGKDGQLGFCHLFKLLLQMRNSITGSEVDYLISPIADENGKFFDSRKKVDELPHNADANGAYNIARKGLMIVEGLRQTPADKLKAVTIATSEAGLKKDCIDLTNKAYLRFVQQQ